MAKRVFGLLALMAVSAAALVLLPATAQAQGGACDITAAYQGTATFGTNLTVVNAGNDIIFEGTGWPPNVTLDLSVNGASVGTVNTDGSGNWTFTYTLPANATGTQTADVACGSFVLSTQFSVASPAGPAAAATTAATGTSLPVTGSNSLSWAQIGIALIALGAVLVFLTRRRSQHTADV